MWGEIRRFIQTSRIPLEESEGGPLVVNHLHIRKIAVAGHTIMNEEGKALPPRKRGSQVKAVDGLSYLIGRVSAKGEGLLGHHIADVGDGIPRTLFVADEASAIDDETYDAASTWANRKLVIGNPLPCQNFFKRGVKEGDLYAKE